MEEQITAERLTIGIVGGGRGGSAIYNLFGESSLCEIKYIVDQNINAPALNLARNAGIETSSNIKAMVMKRAVDLIVEATGAQEVFDNVQSWSDGSALLLSSKVALLIFNILDENRKGIFQEVYNDISAIRGNIISETDKVKKSLSDISDISLNMKILSFNAGVEAAHARGDSGGFAVIAAEFGHISNRTRKLADEVNEITDSIAGLTHGIDESLEKFK